MVVPQNIDFEFIESKNIDDGFIKSPTIANAKEIENLKHRMSKTSKVYIIEHQ
jgi:hypothetical protein